jgi:DNA-binding transcriptional LysR family regulator
MLDLNDFLYFVQVVDRGGFTAASRTLRLPKSTLSIASASSRRPSGFGCSTARRGGSG